MSVVDTKTLYTHQRRQSKIDIQVTRGRLLSLFPHSTRSSWPFTISQLEIAQPIYVMLKRGFHRQRELSETDRALNLVLRISSTRTALSTFLAG
jgi:hypothetical protein